MASTTVDLFARRAALSPTAVAVACAGRRLSYRELFRQSNRLARRLVAAGIGPEALVALHLGRGLEMVVAMLAVHQAGAAYVPLDPAFPADRLDFMLRDCRAAAVLAAAEPPAGFSLPVLAVTLAADLSADDDAPLPDRALPQNLAYVLYTSGSTGRPKGVAVTQGALVNFLLSMQQCPGFAPDDVLVAVTTLSFDIAALEIFLPLISGGRLEIAPREVTLDGTRLAALLAASSATVLQATPATWKLLLAAGWQPAEHLRMLCGGEALPRELARTLLSRGAPLWNLYGPTETTVWSAVAPVEPGPGAVPIGRPIAATELCLCDDDLRPVMSGTPGSLYIGGAGLARGYLGRPDLTAERFIPHPWSPRPGERLYATGDLAAALDDGQLQFLGRADQQIKLRGFRIELGEIESVLLEHPGVRDAAVVAAPSRGGELRLVAYLVARRSPAPGAGELREQAARRLPEHMLPAAWVFLPALPLTPNGKVDRRALPPPASEPEVPAGPFAARSPAEELVLAIWADLLEQPALGSGDDFFAAGGHSLLAGQVMARLRDALGTELATALLFEHPTAAGLARAIEARQAAGAEMPPPLTRAARQTRRGPLPVSYAQERLWLYERLEPGGNAFNMVHALRLRGSLARSALVASLAWVVRRHETLRTRIGGEGRPFVIVDPPSLAGPPLPLVSLAGLPAGRRPGEAERLVLDLGSRPFDLARGPLLRTLLLALAPGDHILSLSIHHLICDGWSLGVLVRDLTAGYAAAAAGRVPALPDLPVQYADYAAWQRGWLAGERLGEQLAFWIETLAGARELALLPVDRPAAGGAVGQLRRAMPAALTGALLRLGRAQGATLFMTLLAAVLLLLHRYTGSRRVAVGALHANRGHRDLAELIGFFVNVLPIAVTLNRGWTFRELLGAVRAAALGAYAHQDAPYQKVLEMVRPDRRAAGRNALFQVMMVLQNAPLPPLALPGIEVTPSDPVGTRRHAAFDLTLAFLADSAELTVLLEYDEGLYEPATIACLGSDLEHVLAEVTRDPSRSLAELPCLDEAERRDRARPGGTLRLTAVSPPAGGETGAAAPADLLAARRSKLSPQRLELLRRRLNP